MSTFPQLRSQARALESRCEGLISNYSTFTSSVSSSATEDEVRVSKEIDECLQQREELIASLNRVLESEANVGAAKSHQVQRHREILQEHKNEYRRIHSTIQSERNRTNLLSSVQQDIQSEREREQTEEAYMMGERSRIDNSNSMADSLLAQAYETRDEFLRQRANLSGIQRRIMQSAGHIPGLNTIIAKVNTRKKRDSLIIAALITLCILFLFFIR